MPQSPVVFQSEMTSLVGLLISLAIFTPSLAIYTRKTFFEELTGRYKLGPDEAALWSCIAESHSNYESGLKREAEHGIFQINGDVWCRKGQDYCNLDCSKLLDDNLLDDLRCARKIYRKEGQDAWKASKDLCKPHQLVNYKPPFNYLEKCQVARKLNILGVSGSKLATLVCIAERETGFDTSFVKGPYPYYSFGLFHISGYWWCKDLVGGSELCEVPCFNLLDTDLYDDLQCVQTVLEETAKIRADKDGFYAWSSYEKYCKNQTRNQEDLQHCFYDSELRKIFGKAETSPLPAMGAYQTTTPAIVTEKDQPETKKCREKLHLLLRVQGQEPEDDCFEERRK